MRREKYNPELSREEAHRKAISAGQRRKEFRVAREIITSKRKRTLTDRGGCNGIDPAFTPQLYRGFYVSASRPAAERILATVFD